MADKKRIVTFTINPALDLATSVEELRPFSKLRCIGERRDPGGGGINVARVVKRFGGDPLAIFPAGGPIGDYLVRLMCAEGIDNSVVPIAGVTREDVTVTETKSGQQYRFVLAGPSLAAEEWQRCLDEFARHLAPETLAVASGSLPPGMPEDFYGRLADVAKSAGAKLLLDCSSGPLQGALHAGVHLIKPNLREFRGLTGEPLPDHASCVTAARKLIATRKVDMVLLSLADQGALLVTAEIALRATAPRITLVSSVGAGDSLLGAFVWGMSIGDDLRTSFRRAVAAGSAALLSEGTDLCRAPAVEALARDVIVELFAN